MASEIRHERVYGNFKPRGPRQRKTKNSQNYKRRSGMSDEHLDLVRQLPCCVCGARPRSEAHHLKAGTGERGMGLRSTDRWAVPLCRDDHDEVERIGAKRETEWFRAHGIDQLSLALGLWSTTGDLNRMIKVMEAHR